MYRHKELEAEVHTKTTLCNRNVAYCICGVAVRAGKDVFVVDNCATDKVVPPAIVYCNDRVLYRQIKRTGSSYEIMLPHGTKVVMTYRVTQTEDLFESANYENMNHWSEELILCDCFHKNSTILNDNTKCTSQRKCTNVGFSDNPRHDTCDLQTRRKKRDAGGIVFDRYLDTTTAFYPNIQLETKSKHNVRSKRRAAYTNVTARADCLQMMNTSIFQKCDKIPNFDTDGMINNCVLDTVLTDTMDWTMAHLESIKQTCIEYLEVMQPLPPDVRAQLVVLPDDNVTDETYDYPILPPPTLSESGVDPFSAEILDDIKSQSCPNECEGHGQCENGTCKCDDPYTSFDCSIDRTKPPIMLGIPDKGECDLQQRRCAETAVFGRNFAETSNLSCRLEHFVVDQNNKLQRGDSVHVDGSYESMFEVYCRFPEVRRKRSVPDEADSEDEIAYGYYTSVSNDGEAFSEGDTIIIYDSQCVNCTKVQGGVKCIKKSGYCLRQGRCYSPGETSDCLTCADKGEDDVDWSTASGCETVPKDEAKNAWVTGLIAGSCVVAAIALAAVVCYIGKRKPALRDKVTVSMSVTKINRN